MSWEPIVLEESRRAQIRDVLGEIAAALDAWNAGDDIDTLCDRAVLRAYLAADDTVVDEDDASGSDMARAARSVVGGTCGPQLFGGLARVGWTIAHLAEGDDAAAACSGIDDNLARQLAAWTGDYDLVVGLVGFGVYALERGEAGVPLLRTVLDRLEDRARPRLGGIAWYTAPELLVESQRAIAPDGFWNLGVAHGLPGVIALLARCASRGIDADRCRQLLDGAVRYLLAVEPPPLHGPRYPGWHPRFTPANPRLAWCYGDLGIATVLVDAGLRTGEEAWVREGLTLARTCAALPCSDARVVDTALCHGSAGIAHLFNRLAQATSDDLLRAAAGRWIDDTLAMRVAEPIAGFPAALNVPGEPSRFAANATLLAGAAGVALALHAAIASDEPAWDRVLLADVAPRR